MTPTPIDPRAPSHRRTRVNPSSGWAYAGSQRHIQAYVNTPAITNAMNRELTATFGPLAGTTITWRAPLADDRYDEPCDETFWAAIGHPELAIPAATWWPTRGPSWDAVALAHPPTGEPLVLLIEAKANLPEFTAGSFGAKNPVSVRMIQSALEHTRARLHATAPLDTWMGPHYQLANRLTWAHWLRANGVTTLFGYIVFFDDRSHVATSREDLLTEANAGFTSLGLSHPTDWYATVALPATG